eukprot:1914519-Amphidinium_carterae.1
MDGKGKGAPMDGKGKGAQAAKLSKGGGGGGGKAEEVQGGKAKSSKGWKGHVQESTEEANGGKANKATGGTGLEGMEEVQGGKDENGLVGKGKNVQSPHGMQKKRPTTPEAASASKKAKSQEPLTFLEQMLDVQDTIPAAMDDMDIDTTPPPAPVTEMDESQEKQ